MSVPAFYRRLTILTDAFFQDAFRAHEQEILNSRRSSKKSRWLISPWDFYHCKLIEFQSTVKFNYVPKEHSKF